MGKQKIPDGIHRHLQGLILGIAIHSRGDQGERHGFTLIGQSHFQRGAVCRDQQFPLPVAATLPDGTDGVNDKLCRQAVALRDLGLSRFAAAQGAALGQQLRSGGTVDSAVHASAAQQALVGGVDDGIHLHGGNIISHDIQGHDDTSSLDRVIIP